MGKDNIKERTHVYKQTNIGSDEHFEKILSYINNNDKCRSQYAGLLSNTAWRERFEGYFKGKKTLPLLYDPFFKTIFSQDFHKERLAELISSVLGQPVDVIEVIPNEDTSFMGILIIMDILVKMSDGSLANIEVQKAAYLFPAERISCYSSDLMMRQYNKLRSRSLSADGEKFSYKELKHVHTIVFFERSSQCLINKIEPEQYFHVGKTKFNTGIDIELLQDFNLISLDTFKKYRYSTIINGNTDITGYDCDDSAYNYEVSVELKKKRLMYMSLLVTETVSDLERLLAIYPELEGIVTDMNYYMTRPEEVLNMFSEALHILDKNSMELIVDEISEKAKQAEAERDKAVAERDEAVTERNDAVAERDEAVLERDMAVAERDAVKAELERLKAELAKMR